jgi:hypothetical protein
MTLVIPNISPDLSAGCLNCAFPFDHQNTKPGFFSRVHKLSAVHRLLSISQEGTIPLTTYAYRSSLLEIWHQPVESGWTLHWDEKFFDYMEHILFDTFSVASEATASRLVAFKLFCIHAECFATRSPAFALTSLNLAQSKLLTSVNDRRMSDPVVVRLRWIYLLVRTLVYLHEQAHHDVLFSNATRSVAECKLDVLLSDLRSGGRRPPSFGQDIQTDKLVALLSTKEVSRSRDETIVDYLAFTRLLEFERQFRYELRGASNEEALALVYPSVMIWHYVCTTIWGIRTHLTIRNALEWGKYTASAETILDAGHVRNNLRGFLIVQLLIDQLDICVDRPRRASIDSHETLQNHSLCLWLAAVL